MLIVQIIIFLVSNCEAKLLDCFRCCWCYRNETEPRETRGPGLGSKVVVRLSSEHLQIRPRVTYDETGSRSPGRPEAAFQGRPRSADWSHYWSRWATTAWPAWLANPRGLVSTSGELLLSLVDSAECLLQESFTYKVAPWYSIHFTMPSHKS